MDEESRSLTYEVNEIVRGGISRRCRGSTRACGEGAKSVWIIVHPSNDCQPHVRNLLNYRGFAFLQG